MECRFAEFSRDISDGRVLRNWKSFRNSVVHISVASIFGSPRNMNFEKAKKIIELETEIESDSKLTDSSEEENSITKSEEGDFFEKTNDMVGTDSESVEEPVENNSSYMKYISAQNVCSSDDENPASELDLKGVNTNQMNNSHDQYFNVINCDVSCPVRLEWEKTRRHDASFTRNIHNLEDTLSTSKRLLNLQHMKSAFLTSDNIVYTQRPSFKSNDEDEGQEYLRFVVN
ncbi:unnamed protein product [Mytilus edulis]|uniref:Uncharacterized protein n=1 Tax=Mytilus edulis TaxID=6550 RepID=A0A8S3SIE0_MYTED|nr:unnamed protein product [Mytilus edulis]